MSAATSCVRAERAAAQTENRSCTIWSRRRVGIPPYRERASPQGLRLAARLLRSCSAFSDCRTEPIAVKSKAFLPGTRRKSCENLICAMGLRIQFQTTCSWPIHRQNGNLPFTLFVDVLRRNAGT